MASVWFDIVLILFADSVYCFGFQMKVVFSQGRAVVCVAQGRSDTLTHSRTDVHSSHSRKSSPSAKMNEHVVLIERCVFSARACTCSARIMTSCESQTGTQSGLRVFLWIFNGRCWSSRVWNKNNSSSKTWRLFCWNDRKCLFVDAISLVCLMCINPLHVHCFILFRTNLEQN